MNESVVKQLSDVLRVDSTKLTEALSSEEETISLDVPKLHTEEELNQFGSNRFNEGKSTMNEILGKELNEQYNLGLEGSDRKKIEKVLDAYANIKLNEAGQKPNEQIEALKKDKAELQKLFEEEKNSKVSLESEYKGQLFKFELDSEVRSYLPEKTIIPKKDLLTLFNNSHKIGKDDDGRTVVYNSKNEIIKDKLLNPIPVKDLVSGFAEPYIKKEGMGMGDRKGSGSSAKFAKMSEFRQYCADEGLNPMSQDALKHLHDNKENSFDYAN